ncbi:MAG: ribulose-phosphate 3-epimerase, partial [Spirochaetia bacterium]|nr:ribulose-phosphate 3-epimerase [Spirochaetia bacterium]
GIEKYFPYVDQILIMSVFPGFGGQKFMEESLERGKKVSAWIKESGFKIDLEIDGGVSDVNAERIREAGFNVLVSGNALFQAPSLEGMIRKLKGI